MTAALSHQFPQLARFLAAFLALYVILPRWMWRVESDSLLDAIWQRLVRMVAFTIALVYCLVLADLYEVLSFACCIGLLVLRHFWLGPERGRRAQRLRARLAVPLYDTLDGLTYPSHQFKRWVKRQSAGWRQLAATQASNAGHLLLLMAVLGYAAYLRYYDPLLHAAPAMSDAYVTLAWLKYIERHALFHDGIYPQGFHIILSTLHKFAGQDALYTLKLAGPLCGVLTTCGVYYATSQLTGRRSAGLVAAILYGLLGAWLPAEWPRQAATNSQEFALIFLLPTWYWSHRFLSSGRRNDWWAACCGCLVIGWVHTLVYLYLLVGLCCLGLAHLLSRWRSVWPQALPLILGVAASGVLAALPLGIGWLAGQGLHESSVDFITTQLTVSRPPVTWIDLLALTGLVGYPWLTLPRRHRRQLPTALFLTLLGGACFAIYEYIGPWSGNAVLATRSNLLWAMVSVVGCGVAWQVIWTLLGRIRRVHWLELLASGVLLSWVTWQQPQPALPYKMQTDSMVEQYLRISRACRPTEWMMVCPSEGYALALGQGYHMHLGDFLRSYAPDQPGFLCSTAGEELLTPDIFLYREKQLFVTGFEHLQADYAQRGADYQALQKWLQTFAACHSNLSLYYQDDTLEVWRIDQHQLLADSKIILWRR